ncbi:HDOD domain-containing protein [Colwellia sp. MEBiC06753]
MKLLLVGASEADQAIVKQVFSRGNHLLSIVESSELTLELLQSERYDVLVADNQLADISELLSQFEAYAPLAVRIVLCAKRNNLGHDNSHFQLNKPLKAAHLVKVLESAIPYNKAITKQVIVKAVNNVTSLPSPPKVYMQLNELLKDDTTDSGKIAEIIGRDPSLVAKVMQFVNSSAMSKGKKINNISDAITKMGVDTLCCIVMTAEMFSYQLNIPDFSIEKEQLHSLSTAKLAASLVKPELKANALLAGLLHDIGKLVLFDIDSVQTKKFFKNRFNSSDNILLERKIFATDHANIGGYLLHLWGFDYSVIESIVLHHQPKKLLAMPFGVAHAIYIADTLLRERELADEFIAKFNLTPVLDKIVDRANRFRL